MEYLSRCLHELTLNPDFHFHPRCEKLAITHMMFADDLLLFARADPLSASLLYQAFEKFSCASGLAANLEKSSVYFGGVPAGEQAVIQQVLPIPIGCLPIRYLGVPLTSKKLSVQDCKPLIENIVGRIRCWTTRFLSYAGRLQLVKSVLFGMQTYWAQISLLPKKRIREIEACCRIFLWTGQSNPSKRALVAWSQVCLPKVSGGWNVISLGDWNKAAVSKLSCCGPFIKKLIVYGSLELRRETQVKKFQV